VAAGISSAGQLQEVLALVRRRIGQVLLPAVLTGALGVMAGSLLPAKFKAETTMELGLIPQPLVEAGLDHSRLRDRMNAAESVLRTFTRLDEVLSALEWEHYEILPPDERREFVRKFIKDVWITTETPPSTNLVFMKFGAWDTDPQRAAQFANELRDYFVRELIADVSKQARDQLDLLNKDFAIADEAFEAASRRLEELRKDNKISPTQSFGSGALERESDPLFVELQAEYSEQTQVQKRIQAEQAEREALIAQREAMPETIRESETQLSGGELLEKILLLQEQIAAARVSQVGKKPAHPGYIKAEADIREYERQIQLLEGQSEDPTSVVSQRPNPARAVIDEQIAALELSLAKSQAQLAAVERNIADLEPRLADRTQLYALIQRETDNVEELRKRRNELFFTREVQSRLVENLALPDFSPFDIVQEALPPLKPGSPSALFLVAGGIVLGLALGALVALVAEFGRNAYRSPGELARALPAPVLGAINEIVTLSERRQRVFRSALVGGSTLVLAGAVLWITWAFHFSPSLLGPELASFLDDLRGRLR
jgi:uncharacterized protein involved in exopolysaccharide biosynthesis